MKTLRNPRLNSTVVSVAVDTFFSASRLYDESMVEFQRDGGIARIFLNRPQKVNAFDSALLDALAAALGRVDDGVRVVVLGGHGTAFCAGADVNELRSLSPATARVFIGKIHRACDAVRKLPMPVVARLHGAV